MGLGIGQLDIRSHGLFIQKDGDLAVAVQGGFELFLQDGSRGNELWDKIMTAGAKYDIGPGAPNHVERVESGLLS